MRRLAAAVLVAVLGLAACGDGGDDTSAAADRGAGGSTDASDDAGHDQSPFCVTIRSLEALGSQPDASDGSPEEVLRQNAEVIRLLDDATASAPEDAPADVQSLFDDYRVLSDAIDASAGDADAAFAALSAGEPELMARLGQADAHHEAFTFFSERCGTAPPTTSG